jgi:hypothetical protein
MRILKLTLGKIIFLQIFLWFLVFQCQASRQTWLTVRTQAALLIANLIVDCPNELVTRPGAILTGIYPSLSFSASRTPLHFYWFIMSCCVCFSRGFLLRFWHSLHVSFSFRGILFVFLCSFKFLCFLEYWNIFLRYCAWKSYSVYLLGWYLYICAIWIAVFAYIILASNWQPS